MRRPATTDTTDSGPNASIAATWVACTAAASAARAALSRTTLGVTVLGDLPVTVLQIRSADALIRKDGSRYRWQDGAPPESPQRARPFDPLSEQALTGSPSLRSGTARPAVFRGAREERVRGRRSAARSPRRASTAYGWGGSRYPVWVSSKITPRFSGSSESSIRRRSNGAGPLAPCEARLRERLDPGERRRREPRGVAERATIRGGAQRSREYPAQRPRACRGLSRRWRHRPTPRR